MGAVLLVLAANPAMAHHSTAAFDYSKEVTLSGTVKEFEWTNPHMFVVVLVPADAGKVVEWYVDVGTPNINVRHGWKKTDIRSGDNVTMKISPMRNGSAQGHLIDMKLPNGRVLWGPAHDIRVLEENRR